jgi:molybdopterin/thiamine biosynthesis adenylyltransferase
MSTDRYNRQVLLRSFGEQGQQKLAASTIAIIGLGALGTHHAETLTRMGVGNLILIDRDIVELDNLNRQSLFTEEDASRGLPKVEAAATHLKEINSEIRLTTALKHLWPGNIRHLLSNAQLILDGTDNFATRYLLNDYSRANGIPYIYCGVVGYEATCFPILPGDPCLRCLFRDIPDPSIEPACDTAGVWPPVVGVISGLAVDLGLRYILDIPPSDRWPLIFIDLATGVISRKPLTGLNDDTCPTCGGYYEFLDSDETETINICGSGAFQVLGSGRDIDFDAVQGKLKGVSIISQKPFLLKIDTGDGITLSLFRDGRAIIRGIHDPGRAKAIYDKYIGS